MRSRLKGNQQAGLAASGLVGSLWYRATDGTLANINLAQAVQVVIVDDVPELVAFYNDGSEVVLGKFSKEDHAWEEMERIVEAMVKEHVAKTTKIRLGHG